MAATLSRDGSGTAAGVRPAIQASSFWTGHHRNPGNHPQGLDASKWPVHAPRKKIRDDELSRRPRVAIHDQCDSESIGAGLIGCRSRWFQLRPFSPAIASAANDGPWLPLTSKHQPRGVRSGKDFRPRGQPHA